MSGEIVVIGGGAAGMMAAITAARRGGQVTLLEPNERLGKKVNITGKGRCNVTNDCDRETLLGSIRSAILSLPDDYAVLSGHGEVTTVGVERRTNPFLTDPRW